MAGDDFRAMGMALLCLVRPESRCYRAHSLNVVPPLKVAADPDWRMCMRFMHLCYAALGFAVARLIFRRQPVSVTDPVTQLRSSGLL